MSGLIEFIPFRFDAVNSQKQRYKAVAIKATLYFIPFLLAIYPMIWAHGKIYDFEMRMLTQVDEQSRAVAQNRALNDQIQLLEEEMAKKRANTFFLMRYFKDFIGWPIDLDLAGKISFLKNTRDLAVKTIKSGHLPSYINNLKIVLEFLSTILLLYICFISVKFYSYLLFRLAPYSGIPVVYSFPHSDKQEK